MLQKENTEKILNIWWVECLRIPPFFLQILLFNSVGELWRASTLENICEKNTKVNKWKIKQLFSYKKKVE